MYISPNGMKFESYEESMEFNRKEINKMFDKFFENSDFEREMCYNCGRQCAKKKNEKFYICIRCGAYNVMEGAEDESQS